MGKMNQAQNVPTLINAYCTQNGRLFQERPSKEPVTV
jgi:hypothetical protein